MGIVTNHVLYIPLLPQFTNLLMVASSRIMCKCHKAQVIPDCFYEHDNDISYFSGLCSHQILI